MDGGGSENLSTQQLPALIREWMAGEEDLRALSAEIREKRKRLTMVRSMITRIMKGNKVGQLNISAGRVVTRTKTTKQSLTKKYIVNTLTEYFNGDKAMAEKIAKYLDDHRGVKQTDSLTLDPTDSPQ